MKIDMKRLRSIVREDTGDSMMETALSAMTLLIVIFGTMDIARAAYIFHFVSYAAQQGTRYAMVRGADWGAATCTTTSTLACNATSANVQSYVRSLANSGMTSSNITVTTTWPGTTISGSTTGCSTTNSQGCLVKVKVSYPFSYMMSFLPHSGPTFTGTSETVIQQ
jgi:Flp pilus assembly protein TadG